MLGKLWKEIAGDLRAGLSDAPQTRTITVAKPYCSPARRIITGALQPYGVKIHAISERVEEAALDGFLRRMRVELRTWDNLKFGPIAAVWLPMAIIAEVTVNAKAAAWAEYLLLRTGRLYVPRDYVDPRNKAWAERHGGTMPPAWNDKKPWIETSCQKGMDAWGPVRKAMAERKK